ncbi:hypothetical protein Tco_1478444, partial [Tanacetum coccineum]
NVGFAKWSSDTEEAHSNGHVMDDILFSDLDTHGLRVGKESAMKAIGVAFAYVLRTAPLGQLESGIDWLDEF